jgi:mRNA-degrading endonuclease toxin of MazEF toxin-antitoxin module
VARRGEVFRIKRAMGFRSSADGNLVVILQADELNRIRETTVVAPLDDALDIYDEDPTAIRVTGREAGSTRDQVVLVPEVSVVPLDRLEPSASGVLDLDTQANVDEALRMVLSLD